MLRISDCVSLFWRSSSVLFGVLLSLHAHAATLVSPVNVIADFNRNGSDTSGAGASIYTINGSGFSGGVVELGADPTDSFSSTFWYVRPNSIESEQNPPINLYYDLGEEKTLSEVYLWQVNGDTNQGDLEQVRVDYLSVGSTPTFSLSGLRSQTWNSGTGLVSLPTEYTGTTVSFPSTVTTRYLRLAIESVQAGQNFQYGFNEFAVGEVTGSSIINGLVAEAEAGQLSGTFAIGNDANASGGQYIHGPNGSGNQDFNTGNRADFTFNITQAGDYRIDTNVYALDGANDSFYVTVDGLPAAGHRWHPPHNTTYRLDPVHDRDTGEDPVIFSLGQGLHTVSFHIREDGTRLDRIELVLVNASPNSSNTPPTINAIADQTHTEGGTVNLQVSASDVDGDTLTYSQTGLPQQLSLNSGTGQITGTVTTAGTYNVTITANDNNGGIDTEDFIWVVEAISPLPTATLEIEAESGQLFGDFEISNDANASGGQFVSVPTGGSGFNPLNANQRVDYSVNISEAGDYKIVGTTLSPSASNNSFYVTVDGQPSAGHLWDTEVGTTYVQDEVSNRQGEDPVVFNLSQGTHTISFHARDRRTQLDKFELVRVDGNNNPPPPPENNAPVITSIANQTNTEGENVTLQISASDADGDVLTYSQTGLPQQLSLNSGTGQITGTVTTAGTYNVTITASDNNGGIDTEDFTWGVNAVSSVPTATLAIEAEAGELFGTFTIGNDSAASGGQYVHATSGVRAETDLVNRVDYRFNVSQAGRYRIDANVYAVDGSDDSFWVRVDGEPSLGYQWHIRRNTSYLLDSVGDRRSDADPLIIELSQGEHVVGVYLREHRARLDRIELVLVEATVNSSNTPPAIASIANQVNTEGDTINLQVSASDADGDTLTYSQTGLPQQLSLNSGTGQITGALTNPGVNNVTITANDNNGGIDTEDFIWTVNATAPTPPPTGSAQLVSPVNVIADFNRNGSDTSGAGASIYTINGSGFSGGVVELGADPTDSFSSTFWYVRPNSIESEQNPPINLYYDLGEEKTLSEVYLWQVNGDTNQGDLEQVRVDYLSVGSTPTFSLSGLRSQTWNSGTGLVSLPTEYTGTTVSFPSTVTTRYLRLAIESVQAGQNFQYGFNEFAVGEVTGSSIINGLVAEAEAGQLSGTFAIGNDANASGGQYIHGPNGSGNQDFNTGNRADFTFNITQAGDYRIDTNVYALDGANDSFYVTVDGLPAAGHRWHPPHNTTYRLDPVHDRDTGEDPVIFSLGQGLHTVSFHIREDGTRLDRIELVLVNASPNSSNTPPTINAIADQTHTEGGTVNLQVSASDVDGDTLTYSQTGLPQQLSLNSGTGQITGTVTTAGTYNVTITANDNNGGIDTEDFIWVVEAISPLPTATLEIEAESGQLFGDFEISNDANASGGQFVSVPTGGSGFNPLNANQRVDYSVNISEAGDYKIVGTTLSPSASNNSFYVTVDGQPSAGHLWDTEVGTTYVQDEVSNRQGEDPVVFNLSQGTHTISFHARDRRTQLDKFELVRVDGTPPPPSNADPVIASIADQTNTEGETVALQVSASDADGDILTYSQSGLPQQLSLNSGTGEITGTITAAGTYNVTITVNDNNGGIDTEDFIWVVNEVVVQPSNTPPVISPIADQTNGEGSNVTLSVDASDSDGDTLSYIATGLPPGLSINVNSGQISGSLSNAGAFSVVVTVRDGNGGSASATFNWNVSVLEVNLAPIANVVNLNVDFQSATAGTFIATDENGDALTYSIVSAPSKGNVAITDAATGAFTYTPNANQNGVDSFTYRASDGAQNSNTATVHIAIRPRVNTPPIAISERFSTGDRVRFEGRFRGTDFDGDSIESSLLSGPRDATLTRDDDFFDYRLLTDRLGDDSFTFLFRDEFGAASNVGIFTITRVGTNRSGTLPPPPPNTAPTVIDLAQSVSANTELTGVLAGSDTEHGLIYYIDSQPTKGHVVLTNDRTGQYRYWPNAGESGTDSFTYRVQDFLGLSSETATVTVNISAPVENSVPTIDAVGNQAGVIGDSVDFGISANDANGDNLIFSATGLPPQIGIDSATGRITGTAAVAGIFSVAITVDDQNGGRASDTFTWTVAPVLVSTSLIREAEEAELFGSFTIGNDGNASGGQYIHAPNGSGNHSTLTDNRADFIFNITQAGAYQIDANVYAAGGNDDSFFLTLDGAPANGYRWHPPHNTSYQLDTVHNEDNSAAPVILNLSTGLHTLSFYVREDGTRLDRIELVGIDANSPPSNTAPVANNASISVAHNTATNAVLTASDADGDALTFNRVSNGVKGNVTINSDGSFTYTPNNGESGPDSFTFRVNDGQANSNVATVSITIAEEPIPENNPPSANNGTFSVQAGGVFDARINGSGLSASDTDGDSLTYQIVSQPSLGNISYFDSQTGEFVYVSSLGQNFGEPTSDSFTYIVTDARGGKSDLATVSITVSAYQGRLEIVVENTDLTVVNGDPINGAATLSDGTLLSGPRERGDINNDGITDALFQARDESGQTYLVLGGSNIVQRLSSEQLGNLNQSRARFLLNEEPDSLFLIANDGRNASFTTSSSGGVNIIDSNFVSRPVISGTTEASYSVGENGQLSYNIPIFVPPGQGGMQPELLFNISSTSSGTFMGVGAGLGGLSTITRCGRTIETDDGITSGVNFDANDRFCLEGQRLIAINGTYGASGTQYRTETDTFSRITSRGGNLADGPSYFEVETKSGNTMFYGNTNGSRIEAQGRSVVAVWAINKIMDAVDNEIDIQYHENELTGEFYPLQINYAPDNTINFVYDQRPDPFRGYQAGSQVSSTVLLSSVRSTSRLSLDNNTVREYRLEYSTNNTTGRTRLDSVQECTGSQCYRPIDFQWETGVFAVRTEVNASGITINQPDENEIQRFQLADINSDGFADVLEQRNVAGENSVFNASTIAYYLGDGEGSFSSPSIIATGNRARLIGDANGDGRPEIILPRPGGRIMFSNSSAPNGFDTPQRFPGRSINGGVFEQTFDFVNSQFIDLNGDGLTDALIVSPTGSDPTPVARAFLSNGDGTFTVNDNWSITNFLLGGWQVADFDGDGLDDLLRVGSFVAGDDSVTILRNLGVRNEASNVFDFSWDNRRLIADLPGDAFELQELFQWLDMNADGLPDLVNTVPPSTQALLADPNAPGKFIVWFSDGRNLIRRPDWRGFNANQMDEVRLVDYNGDRLPDALVLNDGRFDVYYSDGTNFSASRRNSWGVNLDVPVSAIQFADINGDALNDFFIYEPGSSSTRVDLSDKSARAADTLTSVRNGYNSTVRFNYGLLTDPNVHTPDSNAQYPMADIRTPLRVVSSTEVSNGMGGWHETRYQYFGAKNNLEGRGFVGFRQIKTFEDVHMDGTESVTTVNYLQEFPYIGLVDSSETRVGGVKVSESQNTYSTHMSFSGVEYPYLMENITSTWDIDAGNTLVDIKTTTNVYDDYGNPTQITVKTEGDGNIHEVITSNTYDTTLSSINAWHLDRLTFTRVRSKYTGVADEIRDSSFSYYPNGLLRVETIEPHAVDEFEEGDNPLTLTTTYSYDDDGNITSQTVSGWNGTGNESRVTTTTYKQGTFPLLITNATRNQTELRDYDFGLGVITSQTGPNGLTTTWDYDSFGRRVLETRPDSTTTRWEYGDCNNAVVANCAHFVKTTTSGSAPVITYFDNLNRQIREESTSFTGEKIYIDSAYNRLGQRLKATQPYFASSGQIRETEFRYDNLGRIVHEIRPGFVDIDGVNNGYLKTLMVYTGRTQDSYIDINAASVEAPVTVDSAERKMTKIYDARGNVVQMHDYDGSDRFITRYRYDPLGNLIETIDAGNADGAIGNSSTVFYDKRDRKTRMDDPDMGIWTYTYNAFGELIGQRDAENNQVSMRYDVLGRLVTRVEPEGTTTWTYDNNANGAGIGKLHSVSRTEDDYRQIFEYDSLGRISQSDTRILGEDYRVNNEYDRFSRLDRMTYPESILGLRFATRNHYNVNGYLESVTEAGNAANEYWRATATDQFGNVSQETFGNGVETTMAYDASTGYLQSISTVGSANVGNAGSIQSLNYGFDNLSNLTSRIDNNQYSSNGTELFTETFTYDTLNRLRTASSNLYSNKVYSYDRLGNILNKSDFANNYTYGQRNLANNPNDAGPHAVTQVTPVGGGAPITYLYDNNGRMREGNGRNIGWSSFSKPISITRNGKFTNFTYGPDRARIVQQSTNATTIYLQGTGAHFEKETVTEDNETVTSHRHFIYGGNGMAAIYTVKTGDQVGQDTRYIHKDHLGSLETVTGAAGEIIEKRSFDPFGQSRVAPSCAGPGNSVCNLVALVADSSTTNRGFTGHEHLEEVGLIHMNGRVYDPELGRFLSADPNIQAPFDPQNFNRYSYVNNNPLSYVDPTGFFLGGLFKSLFRAFSRIVSRIISSIRSSIIGAILTGDFRQLAAIAANLIIPGVGGAFVSAYISSGGDFKQGIIAGLTAGIGGINTDIFSGTTLIGKIGNAAAHGAAEGLSRAVQGGSFKDGFVSGFKSKGLDNGAFGQIGNAVNKAKERIGEIKDTVKDAVVGPIKAGFKNFANGVKKFFNGASTGAFDRVLREGKNIANSAGDIAETGLTTVRQEVEGIGLTEGEARIVFDGIFGSNNPAVKNLPNVLTVDHISLAEELLAATADTDFRVDVVDSLGVGAIRGLAKGELVKNILGRVFKESLDFDSRREILNERFDDIDSRTRNTLASKTRSRLELINLGI